MITYKNIIKFFLKELLSRYPYYLIILTVLYSRWISRIIWNRSFLKDFTFFVGMINILLTTLFLYLRIFDKISDHLINQKIIRSIINGKPVSKTYGIIINLPALMVTTGFVFILIYNLYDIAAKGRIYLRIDSDLFIRVGKHRATASIGSPYFILDTRMDDFDNKLMEKTDYIFNNHSNCYLWLRQIPILEKHKVLSWLRERLYWCEEYHHNQLNLPFNAEYWQVISALIKTIPIHNQTFHTSYEWRHDEFDLDVPTGPTNFPRIVIKFYHD